MRYERSVRAVPLLCLRTYCETWCSTKHTKTRVILSTVKGFIFCWDYISRINNLELFRRVLISHFADTNIMEKYFPSVLTWKITETCAVKIKTQQNHFTVRSVLVIAVYTVRLSGVIVSNLELCECYRSCLIIMKLV